MGIDSLIRRIENQNVEMKKLDEHKTSVLEIIHSVDQSNTQISTKIDALKTRQTNLLQKLLTVLRKVEILRCHGAELQQPEYLYVSLHFPLSSSILLNILYIKIPRAFASHFVCYAKTIPRVTIYFHHCGTFILF